MGIFWEDLGIVSTTEPVNMEDIKQLHVSNFDEAIFRLYYML